MVLRVVFGPGVCVKAFVWRLCRTALPFLGQTAQKRAPSMAVTAMVRFKTLKTRGFERELSLMLLWLFVESFTVCAAAFGRGPLVPLVANGHGQADAHTRRFAAFLCSLMLSNTYAIWTACRSSISDVTAAATMHTTMVADAIAMMAALSVEWFHGDWLCILWHVSLLLGFGYLAAHSNETRVVHTRNGARAS